MEMSKIYSRCLNERTFKWYKMNLKSTTKHYDIIIIILYYLNRFVDILIYSGSLFQFEMDWYKKDLKQLEILNGGKCKFEAKIKRVLWLLWEITEITCQ